MRRARLRGSIIWLGSTPFWPPLIRSRSPREEFSLNDSDESLVGSKEFLVSVLLQAEEKFIGKTSLGRSFTMIFAPYATLFLATGNST
jgi:hypothetical protein